MKRRFKSEADLKMAAQRRGFSLPESEKKSPTPKSDSTSPIEQPAPLPVPPPSPTYDQEVVNSAIQNISQTAAVSMQIAAEQNARVVAALEKRLAEASASAGRPLRWKVTVSGRDYEGRITELDIEAQERIQ